MEQPHTHEFCELLAHINDIKERLTRLESSEVPIKTKATLEAVKLQAAKIGLPPEEAESFFNHYESNGWKVGRNPMKSWHSAMINWRKTWQSGIYRANGTNGARKPSVFELKTALDLKKEQADRIKGQYSYETATGRGWNSQDARQNYVNLRNEIKALEQRIGGAV